MDLNEEIRQLEELIDSTSLQMDQFATDHESRDNYLGAVKSLQNRYTRLTGHSYSGRNQTNKEV